MLSIVSSSVLEFCAEWRIFKVKLFISSISKLHKPSGEWTVYIPEDYYFGISKQELDNLINKKQ